MRQEFTGRFEREAQAIAALSHPHVCTLYDVGPNYLAMEFVEGESLAGRLTRGKLAIAQVLVYGAQIASALAAAHAKGIVHRDLKPANIMLGKSGVKVLDFGLAKLAGRGAAVRDETLTAAHAVMGTPAYMAPELWNGGTADARADLYALGVLLHEMATGSRPSPTEGRRYEGLPARLGDVIERCLDPDPGERWQSARDLQAELEWIARDMKDPALAGRSSQSRWLPAAAVFSLAIMGAAAMFYLRKPGAEPPVRYTVVPPPDNTTFNIAQTAGTLALSPDGRSMVLTAADEKGEWQLWLREFDQPEPVQLPGTSGARFPFWSPDSRWVAFFAEGFLKKVDTRGGTPISLTEVRSGGFGGTWSAKGQIVFSASSFSR